MMGLLAILPLVFTLVGDAVRQAEEVIKGAGQGKVKKAAVLEAVKKGLEVMAFWKSGTAEYQNMILSVIDGLIDTTVKAFNITGAWGKKVYIDLPAGERVEI